MKPLDLGRMQEIEGGGCGASAAYAAGASVIMTGFMIASVASGPVAAAAVWGFLAGKVLSAGAVLVACAT